MKIRFQFLLVAIALSMARSVLAGYETNSFFVTLGDRQGGHPDLEQVENARTNNECRPAENDPNGHWGEKVIGKQLSLRFDKDIFLTNEAVIATIIYRNTRTDYDLNYNWAYGGELDFQFVVKDEAGRQLPEVFALPRFFSGHAFIWTPGTQYKYQSDLMRRYGLSKPGIYSVYVKRKSLINKDEWGYVTSGIAKIKIVEKAD